jgi:hypothetical protein
MFLQLRNVCACVRATPSPQLCSGNSSQNLCQKTVPVSGSLKTIPVSGQLVGANVRVTLSEGLVGRGVRLIVTVVENLQK